MNKGKYNYHRRETIEVKVGSTAIGGSNPIRIQSMTNTSTLDTDGSVAQAERIADTGGELVRLTTQGEREATNMAEIKRRLVADGYDVPIVADVHFNPKAAYKAASTSDKVRINPGNFVDAARTFRKLEFTDEEYAAEIEKIREALVPFLNICKEYSTAVRLGVNHGSLSDRIMSRYGDTPAGMVESVMEFLRISRENDFSDIVISIKASNTGVMTETTRLLVEEMEKEDMHFPVHLGVTEAGDAEDGRIKSAAGIGALLSEGIGDTIRVSLSEEPENEIPVAALLCDYIAAREGHAPIAEPTTILPGKERSHAILPESFATDVISIHADKPGTKGWTIVDASEHPLVEGELPVILTSSHVNPVGEIQSWLDRFRAAGFTNPVVVSLSYPDNDKETIIIKAAADLGALLLNGYANGIRVKAPALSDEELAQLELNILQATRLRMSKTEYIACPGCGRTLFDLQQTLKEVKKATANLKGLKIGVMGCIVNGPGEMADADYGYVGAGPGRVSIYRGKELIVKNIPTEEALPALLDLIERERS